MPPPPPPGPGPGPGAWGPSPQPPHPSFTQPNNSNVPNTDEDRYAFLSKYDTIFLVDDSGSMAGSRWAETRAALSAITSICVSHDEDGIDLYFLNHRSGAPAANGKGPDGFYNVASPAVVDAIFDSARPQGRTFTGSRLDSILSPYMANLQRARSIADVKPVNIIVITDGQPLDDPESVIVQHARKLDKLEAPMSQVGIQFFQVGNEPEAREALQDLDDGLVHQGVRDMVDTATFDATDPSRNKVLTADGILKVVLGAVVRRLDRRAADGRRR